MIRRFPLVGARMARPCLGPLSAKPAGYAPSPGRICNPPLRRRGGCVRSAGCLGPGTQRADVGIGPYEKAEGAWAVFSFIILYSARKRKAILRRSRKTDTNPGGKTGRSDEVFRNRHISLHWPARCDTLDTGRGPAYDPVNPARDFGGFRACSQPRNAKDFFGYSFTEVEVCGRMLA